MAHKLSIRYFLWTSRLNSQGLAPIRCRITYRKQRKDFSSGLFCKPEDWSSDKQGVTTDDKSSRQLNQQLEVISNGLREAFLQLQVQGKSFTTADIYQTYRGEEPTRSTLKEAFRRHNERMWKLIGIEVTKTSWEKYNQTHEHIRGFLKHHYKQADYELDKLKLQFLQDFDFYLKTVRGYKQSTINKTIQRFRKVIRQAVAEGLLEKDPFLLYRAKTHRREIVFLSDEELKGLREEKMPSKRLEKVRDSFVFCCYTGLAFKEMSKLTDRNIVTGFDGGKWIKMQRQKTGKPLSIPLLPQAEGILDKYQSQDRKQLLPRISNQKFNAYLKEIAEIIGLEKKLTHHVARKTFASTVLLYNDVPIEIVSELLGHSSITITQKHYGQVVQKRLSQEMARVRSRLREKSKGE